MTREYLVGADEIGAPNGVAPLNGAGDVPDANLPVRLSVAALRSDFAPRVLPWLEAVPAYPKGDSWAKSPGSTVIGTQAADRVISRNNMLAMPNTGLSGKRSDEILADLISNWTPNTTGLILLMDIMLNDVGQYSSDDTAGRRTTAEAVRAFFAYASSRSVQSAVSTSLVYGPGWTAGTSDGTAGRYVDVAWTGDRAWIRVGCVAGAGATVTVKHDTTGATIGAPFATGGFRNPFTGVIDLAGFGPGNHTVRVFITGGAATISGVLVPMTAPPVIVWNKPGNVKDAPFQARFDTYRAACTAVANTFSNVVQVDVDDDWDPATMLLADLLHLNDRGNAYTADLIIAALAARFPDYTQGINALSTLVEAAYTPPAPSYTGPGATVPAQVTGVTATGGQGVGNISWAVPDDGGTTLTAYAIRYRLTSVGGAWTAAPDAVGTALGTVIASLAADGYDVQVAAKNSVGTGPWSTTATMTVLAPPVVYYSDDFNRADGAPGNTPVGTLTWIENPTAADWAIVGNKLSCTAISGSQQHLHVNTGAAGGTVRLVRGAALIGTGLSYGYNGPTGVTGYIDYHESGGGGRYSMIKQTASGAYTTLGSTSGITPAAVDVLEGIWNDTAHTHVLKVNGVVRIPAVTDASYNGTYSGPFNISATHAQAWDEISGTSSTLV